MANYKCKMCGSDIEVNGNVSVAKCDFCEVKQTVACVQDEKKTTLFNRANKLRLAYEFDRSADVYNSILAEHPEEAEAYWGLCLCRYGVEYIDDPKTARKVPTCHRASNESILTDNYYKSALQYADTAAMEIYAAEANVIDSVRRDIVSLSNREAPSDVFVCCNEADSAYAEEICTALTDRGYKVFCSTVTLKGREGQPRESYIYAALSSAKIMLAVGTYGDCYDSPWVKNEWSRFLSLMQQDSKRVLIPCYKDIDKYDIPDSFRSLQSIDIGKDGYIAELVVQVRELLPLDKADAFVIGSENHEVDTLLKTAFTCLEDGYWKNAVDNCDKALELEPECAAAYLGKLMADMKLRKESELSELFGPFIDHQYCQKALEYGTEEFNQRLIAYNNSIIYSRAEAVLADAETAEDCKDAERMFQSVIGYADARQKVEQCSEKGKNIVYTKACSLLSGSADGWRDAKPLFESISDYLDSEQKIIDCENTPKKAKYQQASEALESAETPEECMAAKKLFEEADGYSDSTQKILDCDNKSFGIVYDRAVNLFTAAEDEVKCAEAKALFESIRTYSDSEQKIFECEEKGNRIVYDRACELFDKADTASEFKEAHRLFSTISKYANSELKMVECTRKAKDYSKYQAIYDEAMGYMRNDSPSELGAAAKLFRQIPFYRDSDDKIDYCDHRIIELAMQHQQHTEEVKMEDKMNFNLNLKIGIFAAVVVVVAVAVVLCILGLNNNGG